MGPKGEMVHTFVIHEYIEDFYTLCISFRVDSWMLICCLHGQMILILFSYRVPEVLMEIRVLRVLQGQL